jgi:DNA-binding transcriptional MerR regulator
MHGMLIRELAQQTGVPAKTIRYYEDIRLMPRAARGANNYRTYTSADVERLRFIASARSLGLSLDDVAKILATRDAGLPPCEHVLTLIAERLADIDRRIADMLALREGLKRLYDTGATLPRDDVAFERCVCSLIKTYHAASHKDRAHGTGGQDEPRATEGAS